MGNPGRYRRSIVQGSFGFAPTSCFSREEVLRNDHCFDALLSAYTAYLWARDGWDKPEDVQGLEADGWIWAPTDKD